MRAPSLGHAGSGFGVSLSPLGVSRGMGSAEQASLAPRVRRRGGAQRKEGWVRRWPAPSQRTPPILGARRPLSRVRGAQVQAPPRVDIPAGIVRRVVLRPPEGKYLGLTLSGISAVAGIKGPSRRLATLSVGCFLGLSRSLVLGSAPTIMPPMPGNLLFLAGFAFWFGDRRISSCLLFLPRIPCVAPTSRDRR